MSLSKNISEFLLVIPDCDVEEVLLLLSETPSPIPRIQSFELKALVDEFCYLNFRFYKSDILKLKNALRLPASITCDNGVKAGAVEALCITLRRLAYPNRYVDLMKLFPRTRCELSRIFNAVIRILVVKHRGLLALAHPYLTPATAAEFANAIHAKGSPYRHCFGFLDGTVRPICRPSVNQRDYYNGHKRQHAIKFQSIMLPDGIIASMSGPVDGRRHDSYLLQQSGIMALLENQFYTPTGQPLYLYGDPAYPLRRHLMVPFKCHNLDARRLSCNKRMSQVRQCVEWGFSKILSIFAFLDYKKNLKLMMQPVSKYYIVGTILTNCHTCLNGSQTSTYFGIDAPSLETYLNV